MKNKILALTFVALQSCTNTSVTHDKVIVKTDSSDEQILSQNDFQTVHGIKLRDTLLAQIYSLSPGTISNGQIRIDSSSVVTNKLSQIIYNYQDGVSSSLILATFNGDSYVDHEVLEQNPDMDLSAAEFQYKQLKWQESLKYIVTTYKEFVINQALLQPTDKRFLKSGYTFDHVKTKTDSITVEIRVTTEGHLTRDTIR